ncbi:metallophosphoesterase [Alicyclobacillus fastidiosus]|uniref:Metallophosphoesterase n=2 Tax=Alicyclobacillus fastidiosus TaxID=392011 RepID=A0ABY6ZQY0_9BACL|nr:metallophosphoesterase [Alicyclobacillus fastidiosus]WAH44504.1 metallophosphoesterase [Alicyclobacillus fastidiosus]
MQNLYYDKWINGYHFVVLGPTYPMSKLSKHYDTVLSETQLKWLAKQLAQSPHNKPTFVFLHEPIPNTVAGSNGGYLINGDKLRNILNQYSSVLFFSGHTHYTLKNNPGAVYHDHFTMFNTSSVRNPITSNHKSIGDSEGLYVEVDDHKVTVRGRDFTNRMWINNFTIRINS